MMAASRARIFLSRLLAALLVVQGALAGLCLMTPAVHAADRAGLSDVSSQAVGMGVCAKEHASHDLSDQAGACLHCAQPDQAWGAPSSLPTDGAWVLLPMPRSVVVRDAPQVGALLASALPDPGGSAGDRALLFHLIPRIRI